MFVLERPYLLFFLLLLPGWFLAERLWYPRFRFPLSLIDSEGRPAPGAPLLFVLARRARLLLLSLGYAALVVAASGPTLVTPILLYLNRGNEIILVVDVSPSMAAGDFRPDRLTAAKTLIKSFIATRRNEAVGLVAFGGEAALLSPPTLDYATLIARLDTLKPGMLGEGTALGAGIGVAAAHGLAGALPGAGGNQAPARERHIVVLTDGENNAGAISPVSAATLAADGGFVVSVVGIGSRGEVPLNYVDPETGARRSGTYVSSFDRAGLEAIASRGGGAYYDAADGVALVAAFARISDRSVSLSRTRSVAAERSLLPGFLALSLAALALARLLGLAAGSEFA